MEDWHYIWQNEQHQEGTVTDAQDWKSTRHYYDNLDCPGLCSERIPTSKENYSNFYHKAYKIIVSGKIDPTYIAWYTSVIWKPFVK